jgi:serine/threonine-protein kinase
MPTCPTCRTHHPDGTKTCTIDGDRLLPDEAFASADQDLAKGEMCGEYRLEAKLGEGGFGAVYRGVHPLIGKIAAVKVLHRAYSSNPQIVSRFIAEARAVNQIRHKNIIDIFAFGRVEDGRHFFVMELLEGESFEDLLRRRGRLPIEEAAPILRAIAKALGAAHAAGIAHRDLKPDNVFLAKDADGQIVPKLLDFGIAKLMGEEQTAHKTKTGAPIGTPAFMSPEQCRGIAVDEKTDIYSFGILVFRTLTGQLPLDANTVLDLMFKQIHVEPPLASEICAELPTDLDAPIAAMLSKDPAGRPPTIEAALDGVLRAGGAGSMPMAASSDRGTARPASSSPGSSSPNVRVITDGKLASPTFVDAKTIAGDVGSSPQQSGKTFQGAESDVATPRRSRLGLWVAGAAIAAVGIGVGLGVGLRKPEPTGSGVVAQPTNAGPPPTTTAVDAPKPAGTASAEASPTIPPPASASAAPSTVEIRVTGAPRGGELFLGKTRLGPASEPVVLPFSSATVKLTLIAPGALPGNVDVVPDAPKEVAAPPLKPKGNSALRGEVENPF